MQVLLQYPSWKNWSCRILVLQCEFWKWLLLDPGILFKAVSIEVWVLFSFLPFLACSFCCAQPWSITNTWPQEQEWCAASWISTLKLFYFEEAQFEVASFSTLWKLYLTEFKHHCRFCSLQLRVVVHTPHALTLNGISSRRPWMFNTKRYLCPPRKCRVTNCAECNLAVTKDLFVLILKRVLEDTIFWLERGLFRFFLWFRQFRQHVLL